MKTVATFYAHNDMRDDNEWELEQLEKADVPEAQAQAFVDSRPLYEVGFDFEFDTDAGTHQCVAVHVNGHTLGRKAS